jgi:hypothetical protein
MLPPIFIYLYMKKYFLLLILLYPFLVFSQNPKHDYVWLFGYDSNPDTTFFGGTKIDFNGGQPDIFYENREMEFDITDASICDIAGNLLFYTNGIYIANAEDEVMENGDGLNPDIFTYSWVDIGYPLYQGALILPHPDSSHLYYLIHEERTGANFEGHLTLIPHVLCTKVDMTLDNGLGAVTEKNQVILTDTLDYGKITSTKHANGKDWWILIPEFESNAYYRLLLTSEGVEVVGKQSVGTTVLSGLGQACFSPDGTKYARINTISADEGASLDIYDFDRCTGLLSEHTHIFYPQVFGAAGVAISPNSRFAYAARNIDLVQYDLWASDIEASADTVAIYDGYQSPLSTRFFMGQLAPDGKIYFNSNTTVNTLHVINQPDSLGVACEVIQHGIQLPTLNKFSMPNFPNYRLGPLNGACSPLTSDETITSILCHGDSTGSIAVEPIGGAYPYEYTWSDLSLSGKNIENLPSGNYDLTITDAFDSIYITTIELNEPAELELAFSSTPEVEMQENGTATVIPSGGISPYTFFWNTSPTQDSAVAIGLGDGFYEVIVTDANGCSRVQEVEVGFITSVSELNKEFDFKLYPNPAEDYLIVEYALGKMENFNLQIYDVLGKRLQQVNLPPNENQVEINISDLSKGVYFVKIEGSDKYLFSQRVIIID